MRCYTDFPLPVPDSDVTIEGRNRQVSLVEITYSTYLQILHAAGLEEVIDAPAGEDHETSDPGAHHVLDRLMRDTSTADEEPHIVLPDALPVGVIESAGPSPRRYEETEDGTLVSEDPVPSRPQDRVRDKKAEERAIQLTRRALQGKGWTETRDTQRTGTGYDLCFTCPQGERHVEVKGIIGAHLAFNLTPKEHWRACTDEHWVLVAVTNVLSPRGYTLTMLTRDRVLQAKKIVTGYRVTIQGGAVV